MLAGKEHTVLVAEARLLSLLSPCRVPLRQLITLIILVSRVVTLSPTLLLSKDLYHAKSEQNQHVLVIFL
jgi:hypothetical protein